VQWRGSVDCGSACPSSSPGARLSAGSALAVSQIGFAAAARFGALGGVLPDSVLSDSKSPRRIFRRGLNSCDDEDMPVICPTCQVLPKARPCRRPPATLHGVVFDILGREPQLLAAR
jgi:hypothetical protein